jgi:hypothetical protein
MKLAAWCACWPMLGVLWLCAAVGDAMTDACEGLDYALGRMGEYIDGEDE